MCELHMELFYFITVFTELFKGNSIFICNLVSITLSVRFFVAYLKAEMLDFIGMEKEKKLEAMNCI